MDKDRIHTWIIDKKSSDFQFKNSEHFSQKVYTF